MPRWFIAGFLALQIVLPLEYYACRDNPYDERFAWRMFSARRNHSCNVDLTVSGQAITAQRFRTVFHESVWALLRRGRDEIASAVTESICESSNARLARLGVKVQPDLPFTVALEMTCYAPGDPNIRAKIVMRERTCR